MSMKRFIPTIIISLFIATFVAILPLPANAQGSAQDGAEAAQGTGVPTQLFGDAGIVTTITNLLLFVAGALAVIMIIWGGIRYATSGGNASSVTAAKNTILYAIVGLIVAFLAFAAVNFILGTFAGGGSGFTNV